MATYGTTDRCTGGTPSAHNTNGGSVAEIFDDNTTTWWEGLAGGSLPGYIRYDFGAGVTWAISKVVYARRTGVANAINAYKIQGSQNASDWTNLGSAGNFTNTDGDQTVTFTNRTKYRYVQIYITSSFDGSLVSAREVSMYEGLYTANFFPFM